MIVACSGYKREREMMRIGLWKAGIRENNLKSMIECGKSREGRRIILRFLVSTGLIKRLYQKRKRE